LVAAIARGSRLKRCPGTPVTTAVLCSAKLTVRRVAAVIAMLSPPCTRLPCTHALVREGEAHDGGGCNMPGFIGIPCRGVYHQHHRVCYARLASGTLQRALFMKWLARSAGCLPAAYHTLLQLACCQQGCEACTAASAGAHVHVRVPPATAAASRAWLAPQKAHIGLPHGCLAAGRPFRLSQAASWWSINPATPLGAVALELQTVGPSQLVL
jgi:hypothetical protein